MKCPLCKNKMKWQEGLIRGDGHRDMTVGKYYCGECGVFSKSTESKATQTGRGMAKALKHYSAMSKKITGLPVAVQIGILRERQKKTNGR
jgi:hypothetical protein